MNKEKQIEKMADLLCEAKEHDCKGGNDCLCLKQAEAIYSAGYRKIPANIGDFSDGYHTFNELYHHRAVLFSVICNAMPEKAWKSKLHDTGDMFDGMFIVGIETEQGQATYHYDIEPYWDMFKVKEIAKAPKWDGHTPAVAIERIGNISTNSECGLTTAINHGKTEIVHKMTDMLERRLPIISPSVFDHIARAVLEEEENK